MTDIEQKALALVNGEVFTKNGKIIPADDVYLSKPDPLVEIMEVLNGEWTPDEYAKEIRAVMESRGLEIREKGQ